MIKRFYQNLQQYLQPNKVLVLYGPRRVGKTTLLNLSLSSTFLKYKLVSGDDLSVQQILSSQSIDQIKKFAEGYELLAVDEAQRIPNIGLGLKILVDHVPNIKVIATGSSSFDLSNKIGEPLTGRTVTLKLYPIAQIELLNQYNHYELKTKKDDYLIYGSYPEVLTAPTIEKKIFYLREIADSYLLRDILEMEEVKGSKVLFDLLKLLAFQVGNEVSLAELGSNLMIDAKTVGRYLDLLEKSFIIINIRGYSRNLRKEVTKKSKYYFYDNGIRNAIISNFNSLDLRDDVGKLWENFLVIERLKKQAYKNIFANNYFWRTWDQKEVDLVEEREGKIFGYEFKYSPDRRKLPKEFLDTYSNASLEIISQDNYLDFIT
ncbi:MAG: ATP-binding protein [Candidatus Daviesbacteria bacterium]|nr:ATP-binding protein [Candidatus Daviesbacteria bacterium]